MSQERLFLTISFVFCYEGSRCAHFLPFVSVFSPDLSCELLVVMINFKRIKKICIDILDAQNFLCDMQSVTYLITEKFFNFFRVYLPPSLPVAGAYIPTGTNIPNSQPTAAYAPKGPSAPHIPSGPQMPSAPQIPNAQNGQYPDHSSGYPSSIPSPYPSQAPARPGYPGPNQPPYPSAQKVPYPEKYGIPGYPAEPRYDPDNRPYPKSERDYDRYSEEERYSDEEYYDDERYEKKHKSKKSMEDKLIDGIGNLLGKGTKMTNKEIRQEYLS